jgi:hypothetical protein
LPFRRVHQVPVVIQPIQDFSRGNDLQRQRVLAKSKVVCIMLLGS